MSGSMDQALAGTRRIGASLSQRLVASVRAGPLGGAWLFAWVLLAQVGHLVEHIAKTIQGQGLFGPSLDSELSHLLFNGAIALLSVLLVRVYPANPWVYPLVILAVFHGIEHVYIYDQFLKTGISDGPALLGRGGAIGIVPLERQELHNVYNGFEMIFMTLGLWNETENLIEGSR